MKRITETLVCTFLLLALLWPVSTLAQEREWPNTPEERIRQVKEEFGLIPPIIYNEKEITMDELSMMDSTQFNTFVYFKPQLSVTLAGERGKDGFIYIHSKKDYIPMPSPFPDGYFQEGDRPAVFPGGQDSLYLYIKSHQQVADEVQKFKFQGFTVLNCYIDEEGAVEKCVVQRMDIEAPLEATLYCRDGLLPQSDVIQKKYQKLFEKITKSALNVANNLPRFTPATFYLRNVKYRMNLYIPFTYDAEIPIKEN